MEWDAVVLELVALGLNGVLLVVDSVEESPKLRLAVLEDVDLAGKHCGISVNVLCT